MKILLALLALSAITSCFKLEEVAAPKLESQYVPVSKRYPGYILGNPAAQLVIELFVDPGCRATDMQAAPVPSSTRSLKS